MSTIEQRKVAIETADNLVTLDNVEDLIRVAEWILDDSRNAAQAVTDYVKAREFVDGLFPSTPLWGVFKPEEPKAGDPVDPKNPAPDWIIEDGEGDYWKMEGDMFFYLTSWGDWAASFAIGAPYDAYAPYTYVCPVKGVGIDQIPEGWVFEIEDRSEDKFFWREGKLFFFWEDEPRGVTILDSCNYDSARSRLEAKFTVLDRNLPEEG